MSEKIVQLNEEIIKGQLKELVRGIVEETLNELLEKEAESLTQAARYERSEARQGYRSGHYDRNLTTTSGDVTLHVPRLKGVSFETTIIELNKKAYVHIEDWRNRPLQGGRYPYVYVDGIYLRRNWGGEYENVAILVAIAVNEDGFRDVYKRQHQSSTGNSAVRQRTRCCSPAYRIRRSRTRLLISSFQRPIWNWQMSFSSVSLVHWKSRRRNVRQKKSLGRNAPRTMPAAARLRAGRTRRMTARRLASSFSLSVKSCPVSNRAFRPEKKAKKQEHNDLFV